MFFEIMFFFKFNQSFSTVEKSNGHHQQTASQHLNGAIDISLYTSAIKTLRFREGCIRQTLTPTFYHWTEV